MKLKDRIESYQESYNFKLLNRVPLIICLNGRGFSRVTSLLEKPYCGEFAESMLSTTLKLCGEVEGSLFGYQYHDEIVIVVRNDQNPETVPWYDNKLQKICSITSSIASLHFNTYIKNKDLSLIGDSLFTSQVFVVPNMAEAVNALIYKQQQNFHLSIQFACFYELLKKYDKVNIKEMLSGLSVDEKVDLLKQECGIDFNGYPASFRRGSACYKIPKVVGGALKNKWNINVDLPIFTKDQSFLTNIFKNGSDIYGQY